MANRIRIAARHFLRSYMHPSPGRVCFYVFMRIPLRDASVFTFLVSSLPGTGLFLRF